MNIELDMTKIVGFGGIVFAEVLAIYWILKDKKSLDALKRCDFRRCDSETLFLITFALLNALFIGGHIYLCGLGVYEYRFGF